MLLQLWMMWATTEDGAMPLSSTGLPRFDMYEKSSGLGAACIEALVQGA
jgi:hypothetical protein